jgi:hypothetical protein
MSWGTIFIRALSRLLSRRLDRLGYLAKKAVQIGAAEKAVAICRIAKCPNLSGFHPVSKRIL